MTKLTDIQQEIRTSLETAIKNNNLETVQEIFNSNGNDDIQAALGHENTENVLYLATIYIKGLVEDKEKFEKSVKIIELIWPKTNQEIRDFICALEIKNFQHFQRETGLSDITALKTVIQEMEEHERVTADNKTTENSDTNFWSKHKGKIALGVTGLCVAGAVAAYVLAYPAVALALAVLAAVILMGVGIAKVCEKVEDPSVEKPFTPQQGV